MINFHSEKPADQDLFPGGSHEKVAAAMQSYIATPNSSKVIGLDGEFGSGKSSILEMLGSKLKATDDKYRVWFFDCEQNYQGSIKSNFIELFTEELLKDVHPVSKEAAALIQSRDIALGREFEYSKKTTSNVSVWALLLLASLFFSSSAFKDLSKIVTPAPEVSAGLLWANWLALASPAIVLLLAWVFNRGKDIGGGKKWSLLSLFKGSTHDYINEKIEVSKEVTPLDLKRTLIEQLKRVAKQKYVVILDNLDRLPKESLRSVWSDLEIFTSVASAENLTVVVPFCSTKVAAYLGADADRKYDSRDFIAKKFPVVFRAPPVITSGWKDGFRQMWHHTFSSAHASVIEHCAQLLHRHSPMANGLVTPRLQKKFINDIATTSLVVGDHINLICIAAHLLLCRYNEFPVEEVLRNQGLSDDYQASAELDEAGVAKVAQTNALLNTVIGQDMNAGWQIQILQVHFLTTSEIAVAELLDEPLREAIEAAEGDKLFSLSSLFGFADAFKRLIATRLPLEDLLPTIHAAHAKHGGNWANETMQLINDAKLPLLTENTRGSADFYEAVGYCITVGFNAASMDEHGQELRASIEKVISKPYDASTFGQLRGALVECDRYLGAVGKKFDSIVIADAQYTMHLLSLIETLKIIRPDHFILRKEKIETAYHQLVSTESHPLDMVPLEAGRVIPAANWAFSSIRLGKGLSGGISATDILITTKLCSSGADAAIISLALAETIDQSVLTTVVSLLTDEASDIVRTVAAVVYIRNEDAASLVAISGLEEVIKSELFKSLCNATLEASEIFTLLLTEAVEVVSPYLANLISKNGVTSLSVNWVLKNFTVLKDAVEPHGLRMKELLAWFNDWDTEKYASEPQIMDPTLVEEILATPEGQYKLFKQGLFKFLDSSERSEDGWKALIVEASPQVLSIVHALADKSVPLARAEVMGNAIVAILADYVHGDDSFELNASVLEMISALLNALDQQLRHVIGGHLRALFYSDPKDVGKLFEVITNYGHLILDIQPANNDEATRLIRLLDYLGRYPEATQRAAAYMDERADQLSRYKYSDNLREGMASVVTKLENLTPLIFRKFARKSWFANLFKSKSDEVSDEQGEGVKE